jgi:DNA primase
VLVLHFPAAARGVADPERLRSIDQRGVDVLVELIETAQAEPGLRTMQLVERWRDRPEFARLEELAAGEALVPDAAAAARELGNAIDKLLEQAGPGRRLDELIALSQDRRLTREEQQEFQALLGARGPAPRPPGRG